MNSDKLGKLEKQMVSQIENEIVCNHIIIDCNFLTFILLFAINLLPYIGNTRRNEGFDRDSRISEGSLIII